MVSVRCSSVKTNRVIFPLGINEAEDAVAIGGVGADGGPVAHFSLTWPRQYDKEVLIIGEV